MLRAGLQNLVRRLRGAIPNANANQMAGEKDKTEAVG
jgi:hypothetical protein